MGDGDSDVKLIYAPTVCQHYPETFTYIISNPLTEPGCKLRPPELPFLQITDSHFLQLQNGDNIAYFAGPL